MLYEVYCRGHNLRFKSAGGDAKSGKYFCSGCRKHVVHKFLKSPINLDAANRTTLDLAETLTLQHIF